MAKIAVLLNAAGQENLKRVLRRKRRKRGSFSDLAEGFIGALEEEGRLHAYLRSDVDPLKALDLIAKNGLPKYLASVSPHLVDQV